MHTPRASFPYAPLWLGLALALGPTLGCDEDDAPHNAPAPEEKAEKDGALPDDTLGKMDHNFDAATSMLDAIVAGSLERAQQYGAVLQKLEIPGKATSGPWKVEFDKLKEEGGKVAAAKDIASAAEPAARVLLACARCHKELGTGPGAVPPDDAPSQPLLRHSWAYDRLLEGLYVPHDAGWAAGAKVMSDAPLVPKKKRRRAKKARKLARAVHKVELAAASAPEARAAAYAKLLPSCAQCHQELAVKIRPPAPPLEP